MRTRQLDFHNFHLKAGSPIAGLIFWRKEKRERRSYKKKKKKNGNYFFFVIKQRTRNSFYTVIYREFLHFSSCSLIRFAQFVMTIRHQSWKGTRWTWQPVSNRDCNNLRFSSLTIIFRWILNITECMVLVLNLKSPVSNVILSFIIQVLVFRSRSL